jgi:hypothetical protein
MVIFDINHVKQTGTFPCYGAFHCAAGLTGSITVNPRGRRKVL